MLFRSSFILPLKAGSALYVIVNERNKVNVNENNKSVL